MYSLILIIYETYILTLLSILFAALLMAGCVNDPDIDGGIRNAKKPSVKTDTRY